MNWKRIAGASAAVVAAVAVVFFVKSCNDQRVSDAVVDAHAKLAEAKELIAKTAKQMDSLQNAANTYRDSADFYKRGLDECEKSKQKTNPGRRTPERKPVVTKPVATKPVVKHDTVYVVATDPVKQNSADNGSFTSIRMQDDARNNQNIVVQNGKSQGNDTEIILGNGAVNDGNIVVNNGGNVTVYDNDAAVDSLRRAVDSLKANAAQKKFAAASSVVIVKTTKTYRRVR